MSDEPEVGSTEEMRKWIDIVKQLSVDDFLAEATETEKGTLIEVARRIYAKSSQQTTKTLNGREQS